MPPYSKKGGWKSAKRAASRIENSDASGDEGAGAAKRTKTTTTKSSRSVDGESWQLSAKRKVGLSDFNGSTYVNIREYYEKDGQELPGKKGISLNIEQYLALTDAIPKINKVLQSKGLMDSDEDEKDRKADKKGEKGKSNEENDKTKVNEEEAK